MHLITICGEHAAGKNDVAIGVFQFFGNNVLERVVPCTTRPPRPGELHGREYYFISEEEFELQHREGQFVFDVRIRETQRSGTLKSELFSKNRALVDIVPEGARRMRDLLLREQKGQSLLIFIHASVEERRRRIRFRDPEVSDEKLEQMIQHDPVPADLGLYQDFDLIVENPDGEIDKTVNTVVAAVQRFLQI